MLEEHTEFGRFIRFISILRGTPTAVALMKGSDAYPDIRGTVRFYQIRQGVLVAAEVSGLPETKEKCKSPIFAFHIHEGRECIGNKSDPFADAMTHYNPGNCPHPYHAGDMPPLFGNKGYAFQIFLTDRFTVREVVGSTVIIHANLDDFTTQPSGNAGTKIACGQIRF